MAERTSVSTRILELRQVPMLRALPTRVLAELASAVRVETHAPGVELIAQDEPVRALGWVVEGRARWLRDGRRLGDAERGASLGFLELVAGADASVSVRTASEVTVSWVPAERLFEALEDSFDLVHAMLAGVANDLALAGCRALGSAASAMSVRDVSELDFTERVVRMRVSRPFARAPIRALAVLARRTEVRRWPRGGVLWEAGGASREIVTLVSGEVREGRATLSARDTVGLVAALAGRRRDTFAAALTPATGIVFDIEALTDVLEDDDDLALELLRVAADELLAVGMTRGLPPDVFGGPPDRSLPRVLRASGESYG